MCEISLKNNMLFNNTTFICEFIINYTNMYTYYVTNTLICMPNVIVKV